MAYTTTEMFAQFVYSPDLSYDELHERESGIKTFTEELLTHLGAAFINFEPIGDALHAQCVFQKFSEDSAHNVCDSLVTLMDNGVEARLFFVRKNLALVSLYTLAEGTWQEAQLQLPAAGPIGKLLRKQALEKLPPKKG